MNGFDSGNSVVDCTESEIRASLLGGSGAESAGLFRHLFAGSFPLRNVSALRFTRLEPTLRFSAGGSGGHTRNVLPNAFVMVKRWHMPVGLPRQLLLEVALASKTRRNPKRKRRGQA
jgi:hypothetical protein